MRIRFSLRTLLIGFGVFCASLAFSLRFGPHLHWRFARPKVCAGIVAIPVKPLVAPPPDGDVVTCQIGPISFELPEWMSRTFSVAGSSIMPAIPGLAPEGVDPGGVSFSGADFSGRPCHLHFRLPSPYDGFPQSTISGLPAKKVLSGARLWKEVYGAQSSDFSFGMSPSELRWHQWLLTRRSQESRDVRLLEYLWREDFECCSLTYVQDNYSSPETTICCVNWETVDRNWEGSMYFTSDSINSSHHAGWIRRALATLTIQGDPAALWKRDEATIKSLIKITSRDTPPQE